jgi:hypothetical protein
MSAYHVPLIQPLPVPKVERGVDGRCAMQRYMQFPHAIPADEFDMIVQQTKHPHISFSSQVQGASPAVQVRFSACPTQGTGLAAEGKLGSDSHGTS